MGDKTKWRIAVVVSCAATVCTTAYAKFETEIYPSVIFPSFGQVLDPDDVPPAVETRIILFSDLDRSEVDPRDWFDGPPASALDRLSEKLVDLPAENREWMFDRADELAGTCVERIMVTVGADGESAANQFVRSCS